LSPKPPSPITGILPICKKDLNQRGCRRIGIEDSKSRKRTRDEGEETEAPDLIREARQRVIINSRERKGNPRESKRSETRSLLEE